EVDDRGRCSDDECRDGRDDGAPPAEGRVVVVARMGGERPDRGGDQEAAERGKKCPERDTRDQRLEGGATREAVRIRGAADAGRGDECRDDGHGVGLLSAVSAKPDPMVAASSRYARWVAGCSSFTDASAPASRCGSQGMRTQERHLFAKWFSIRSTSTAAGVR